MYVPKRAMQALTKINKMRKMKSRNALIRQASQVI